MQFKETKLKQDSDEWHLWRKSGVGASEMSVIMGSLPFQFEDVLELWKKKTEMIQNNFVMNDAMRLGKSLEPKARKRYIETTGTKIQPKCFTHPEHDFLRASLDGINKEQDMVVEIKCPGLSKWRLAKQGTVVDYYYTQMQQQMACSGTNFCHYWVYREPEGAVLIDVPRNEEYIQELIRRAGLFWKAVEEKRPILPRELGIDMSKDSDPYQAGDMEVELVGVYKF